MNLFTCEDLPQSWHVSFNLLIDLGVFHVLGLRMRQLLQLSEVGRRRLGPCGCHCLHHWHLSGPPETGHRLWNMRKKWCDDDPLFLRLLEN